MTSILYHEAAAQELLDEVRYLELQASGLGRRSREEVERIEEEINRFPDAGEAIRPGIRRRLLRKFRYALIYCRERNGLMILAVAHLSRRPSYWAARGR